MNHDKRLEETERVVARIMKTVESFDRIGKSEFETILRLVIQEVENNSGAEVDQTTTNRVIEDLPNEFGQLPEAVRTHESMIAYLYTKYLQVLGVL